MRLLAGRVGELDVRPVLGRGALERGAHRVAVDQPPPVAAGAGEQHRRLDAGLRAEQVVHAPHRLGRHLVLEHDHPRRDAERRHLLEVQHALRRDVAAIDADADAVRLRVRADDPQGVLQPDRLGVHQVAQQRRRAHLRHEAVHHLVLGLGERRVERLAGAHHLVADGADRLEQLRVQELGGVVRRELECPFAAPPTKRASSRMRLHTSTGARPQAELGVARRGLAS